MKNKDAEKDKPLRFELNLKVRFGDEPEDTVTVLEDHEMKLVGGIFRYRDEVIRHGIRMVLAAARKQPQVLREIAPAGLAYLVATSRSAETSKEDS